MASILTLTTDFGTKDAYVAAMKGTILQRCPDVHLVDVTHQISPQDVMETAFVLRDAVPYFPDDTVHLVVVDPGVGTERRPVALRADGHYFVGPDNGIFALVLENAEPDAIVALDDTSVWRTTDPSTTFHGRDIFAPAAAHLAAGRPLENLGTQLDSMKRLHWVLPITDDQGIRGWVAHIDHFGNCITNISRDLFEKHRRDRPVRCYVGTGIVDGISHTYGAVESGDPLLLFGSSGYLEIAVNTGTAAELLSIEKGAPVNIIFQ